MGEIHEGCDEFSRVSEIVIVLFAEFLAIWSLLHSSLRSPLVCVSLIFDSPGHSSGQIVSNRMDDGTCVGRAFTHVSFWESVAEDFWKCHPLRARKTSLSSNNRSPCARNRKGYRCLFVCASWHRCIPMEWERRFHPGCETLFDVLRDGCIWNHHS